MSRLFPVSGLCCLLLMSACGSEEKIEPPPPTLQSVGKAIYFDEYLSDPPGQSCASCHLPEAAFTDPDVVDSKNPISDGVVAGRFASRNATATAYAAFIPDFHFDKDANRFVGGQFVDGRAVNLEEQARIPFLEPLAMNNTDGPTVVGWLKNADYADDFETIFGAGALNNPNKAFEQILMAVAAFERTKLFSSFSSKFDAVQAGQASFTASEQNGFTLFNGKADCVRCHQGTVNGNELFTNFQYENIGVPRNPNNPYYTQEPQFNPDGAGFVDLGLGGNPNPIIVQDGSHDGKFRNPTLRNVERTAPYMHNGVFDTLEEVVDFYNNRDVNGVIPEVARNRDDIGAMGELGLTQQEQADLVAFMKTLTDGFKPGK